MNKVTYENQGNNTYLVYEITENDVIDNLSLGMINNNRIPGLASVIYTQLDNRKFLKYNITAKVSATTFLAGAVSKNRMLGVFSGVSKALLSAEEYMLDANTILLDLDYIFVDVSTCEAELICLPIQMEEKNNDVVSFFKNIVFSVTYDQTENCDYVAKIISCLNNHSSFSLSNFMQTIDELNGKRINLQELQNSQQLHPVQKQVVNTEILPDTGVRSGMEQTQQVNVVDNQSRNQNVTPDIVIPRCIDDSNLFKEYDRSVNASVEKKVKLDNTRKARDKNQRQEIKPDWSVPGAPLDKGIRSAVDGNQQQIKSTTIEPNNQVNKTYLVHPLISPYPPQPVKKQGFFSKIFGKKQSQQPPYPPQPVTPPGGKGQWPPRPVTPPGGVNGQQPQKTVTPPGGVNGQQSQKPVTPPGGGNGQWPPQAVNPSQPARYMDFGETTVLSSEMTNGETSVLSSLQEVKPYLLRKKTGEKVTIEGPVFKIGKEHNYVDYFIADNSAISRSHANIVVKGNDYFIVDTNSKNHTYVNGRMIQSNVETPLTHGSMVKLANEEFEFKMY